MRIYLSGPVDRMERDIVDPKELMLGYLMRQTIIADLVVFCPHHAFVVLGRGENDGTMVISTNRYALSISEVMIMCHIPGMETWGVPYELFSAYRQKKPILVYTTDKESTTRSIYLRSHLNQAKIFTAPAAVVEELKRMIDEREI